MYRIEIIDVMGSPMEVLLFHPESHGPHPGILLAQHIPVGHTGIENDSFTLATARRLAENGYVVAVPFIFHWWPKDETMDIKRKESRDDRIVADMQAGYTVLQRQPDVDVSRIAIVGHCWGGRVAWLGACHLRGLRACAIFYGGNIKLPLGAGNPPPIELVSGITAPVMGFFGNEDQNPSPQDVDDYSTALKQAGVEHTFHRYDGAGHAFQNFPMPERYRERQSEDAWRKLLDFLGRELN